MMFIYRDEYYNRDSRAPRRGRRDRRQAPQRPGRRRHAHVPLALSQVREPLPRALRRWPPPRSTRRPVERGRPKSRASARSELCDGSGWLLDEETNMAQSLRAAGSGRINRSAEPPARHGHPQALPRRLLRSQADLRHRPGARPRGAPVRPAARRQPRRGARPVVLRRRRARARPRSPCWCRRRRSRRATRWRSTRCRACSPTSRRPTTTTPSRSYTRAVPPAVRRRPAAPRRSRRREAHRVGAGAALFDRQRALAERALDRRHHQPGASTSCASRSGCARSHG